MAKIIFIIHIFCTFFLTGLIWLVQVVNYPMFAKVGDKFKEYHEFHLQAVSAVVVAPMIVEAITAVLMLWFAYSGVSRPIIWIGLFLVVLLWGITFFMSVPAHNELVNGFNANAHQRLMLSNSIRTVLWSVRAGLMMYVIYKLI